MHNYKTNSRLTNFDIVTVILTNRNALFYL